MATKKRRKTKPALRMTAEQKRNSDIFRLRGFYSNAKTLPFNGKELNEILACVDQALIRLDAMSQSLYILKEEIKRDR